MYDRRRLPKKVVVLLCILLSFLFLEVFAKPYIYSLARNDGVVGLRYLFVHFVLIFFCLVFRLRLVESDIAYDEIFVGYYAYCLFR